MVSHKIMIEFRKALKDEPQSMRELCNKLERSEGSVRTVLSAMEELGLVERVSVCRTSSGKRPVSVGWKRTSIKLF
ncbi:MAG: ArsR family transcriptional regulator [Bacilli bacterium]